MMRVALQLTENGIASNAAGAYSRRLNAAARLAAETSIDHLLPSWRLNCGKALQNDGQQFGRTSISRTGSLMCFNCLPQ
jgi:hypothetical protein